MKRLGLIVLAVLIGLPLAAVLGAGPVLNSGAVRGRLAEAVQRATGHALRLEAPGRLEWSMEPLIELRDAALLNPPGFSRAEFAVVQTIRLRLGLLALLSGRVEVTRLALGRPDVLLERDAAGRGNWEVPVAPVQAVGPARPSEPRGHRAAVVDFVTIANGSVAWLGGPAVRIAHLTAAPGGGPLEGALVVNGVAVAVKGTLGLTPGAVQVSLAGGGLAVAISGEMGGTLGFEAVAADLASVGRLVGRALPPLKDVRLTGAVVAGVPGGLHLTAGEQDVGLVHLVKMDVTAAAMEQPVKVGAVAQFRGLPFAVTAVVDRLGAVVRGGSIPFELAVGADGGSLTAAGTVGSTGVDAALSVRVADLGRMGGLAGVVLPGIRDLAVDTRILPLAGGSGLGLRGFRGTSAQGDLGGDLTIGLGARPSIRGTVVSQRMDLDGLGSPAPVWLRRLLLWLGRLWLGRLLWVRRMLWLRRLGLGRCRSGCCGRRMRMCR